MDWIETPKGILDIVSEFVKRYKNYEGDLRFLFLLDKVQILLYAAKSSALTDTKRKIEDVSRDASLPDDKREKELKDLNNELDDVERIFGLISGEFDDLATFVQNAKSSCINE